MPDRRVDQMIGREGAEGRRERATCTPKLGLAVLALSLAVLALLIAPVTAYAVDPYRLDERISERVGALDGREGEVERALRDLEDDEQVQLWLAYVDSFSGRNAQQWADETALASDLGLNDVLLAVATRDRAYAYSVDRQFQLTDDRLAEVMLVAVEPALHQNDWAGGAIGAATGMGQALRGEQVSAPGIHPGEADPGGGAGSLVWLLLIGIVVVAVVGYVVLRSRRRSGVAGRPGGASATPGRQAPDEYAGLSLDELRRRANQQLVETDDAVKTSEQELGFAVAEFGEERAASFARALQEAREELAEAFSLRRELEDEKPEDEVAQRRLLVRICRRTDAASDRLDAEAERFDELRDLERRAPEVLAGLERRVAELDARLPEVEATLTRLSGDYSPDALKAVADNPEQARSLIDFARDEVHRGQQALASDEGGDAVLAALAAEEAAGQAAQLLEAVVRLESDLSEAGGRIGAAIAETRRDLEEARGVEGDGTLRAAVAAATAALDEAADAARPEGGQDPLGALQRLEEADERLDDALRGVRDEQAQRRRETAALGQALLAARSQVAAAHDFITTRRGAVGSDARVRLAEAQRHLSQAEGLADRDPRRALHEAGQADRLALAALEAARSDAGKVMGSPFPGAFGGGGSGGGMGALIGGILVGSMLGGSGRRGGFGGGLAGRGRSAGRRGASGGFGGTGRRGGAGGFGPAGFGGRGTRMRRGGGGRF
jgi:hypothetical protein